MGNAELKRVKQQRAAARDAAKALHRRAQVATQREAAFREALFQVRDALGLGVATGDELLLTDVVAETVARVKALRSSAAVVGLSAESVYRAAVEANNERAGQSREVAP